MNPNVGYLFFWLWIISLSAFSHAESIEAIVDLERLGTKLKHGVDGKLSLKGWADSPQAEDLCQVLFDEEGFSVFRMPIYAMRPVDDPFYDKVVKLAQLARKANPQVILFASVANGDGDQDNNLHNKHKFPLSMLCGDEKKGCDNGRIYNLDLDAYAAYLDDFIRMMDKKGVSIDWIGPWNEDNASRRDVAYLWRRMEEEKDLVRVGLETWALQRGIEKVRSLQSKLDLIGSHFYDDEQGKAIPKKRWDEKWQQLVKLSKKPVWFTEATDYKEAEIDEAKYLVKALERLIVAANAGIEGIIYYQTVPRIIGYDGKPVSLKHSGLFNFIRKSRDAHRVGSTRLENPNIWLYAHYNEAENLLGIHIANSDSSKQTIDIQVHGGKLGQLPKEASLWNESQTDESVSIIEASDEGCLLVVPPVSYAYVEISVSQMR